MSSEWTLPLDDEANLSDLCVNGIIIQKSYILSIEQRGDFVDQ